jgi:hypothetical protein
MIYDQAKEKCRWRLGKLGRGLVNAQAMSAIGVTADKYERRL